MTPKAKVTRSGTTTTVTRTIPVRELWKAFGQPVAGDMVPRVVYEGQVAGDRVLPASQVERFDDGSFLLIVYGNSMAAAVSSWRHAGDEVITDTPRP